MIAPMCRELSWGTAALGLSPCLVWAHFMHIERREAFQELSVGAAVEFDWIAPAGGQDGYAYPVERVWEV